MYLTQIRCILLQVYRNDGWYFFKSDSLKVLLDALLEKQKNGEQGEHPFCKLNIGILIVYYGTYISTIRGSELTRCT